VDGSAVRAFNTSLTGYCAAVYLLAERAHGEAVHPTIL